MNVCFFSHSSFVGGAERSLLELATELTQDHGVHCDVVLPSDGPLRARLEQTGASVAILDYGWWCGAETRSADCASQQLRHDLEAVTRAVDSVLAGWQPDIFITNTIAVPWGAVAAALAHTPHVWHVRECGVRDHGLKFYLPFDQVTDAIRTSSNLVITNSEAVRRELFGAAPPPHVVAVYNSVAIPEGALDDPGAGACFTRPGATRLVMASGIAKPKRQEDAILAVKMLLRRERNVELIVMGLADAYREELDALVAREDLAAHVKFLEFRENPYPVIGQADIALVCSAWEAFGRVTVEAMLLGKPVVGTNSGGTPELIQDHLTGLLYPPGDPEQLAESIEWLIDRPEQIRWMGANGRAFARRTFTRERYGGRVYELLAGIKGQPNPAASDPRFLAQFTPAGDDAASPADTTRVDPTV